MKLETFADVVASIKKNSDRPFNLLLGNGFSVAYDPKIFSYNALHEFVTNLKDADLSIVLDVIKTRNFEVIMQHLDHFAALIEGFGGDLALKTRVVNASAKLRASLLDAVQTMHPEHVFKIPEEKSSACAKFLQTFLTTEGCIYSTNYDLLLYWVFLRNNLAKHADGCGRELETDTDEYVAPEEQQWSELMWGKNRDGQNVFYLHGALQFFDNGVAVIKEEYDTHHYLLEKISSRMKKGDYPIFVTGGEGKQKLSHITHNQYLTYCYDQFCRAHGSLVTFGFSFGASDRHIVAAIKKAARQDKAHRLWSIYVGVYSSEDKKHIEAIQGDFGCKVHIFDAKTVGVWGDA